MGRSFGAGNERGTTKAGPTKRDDERPSRGRRPFILTPGGFEELLQVISRPAESRNLPPAGEDAPPPSEEELQEMQVVIQAHGWELLE